MKFFGQLVRTVVNVVTVPVAVAEDALAVAKTTIGEPLPKHSATMEHLEKLKQEAGEE